MKTEKEQKKIAHLVRTNPNFLMAKKTKLAKNLKITRQTLDTRLKDGKFKEWQIDLLKEYGYLPKNI